MRRLALLLLFAPLVHAEEEPRWVLLPKGTDAVWLRQDGKETRPAPEYRAWRWGRLDPTGEIWARSARLGGNREIYLTDEKGRGMHKRLTNDRAEDFHPAPAPGAKLVYFVSDRSGSRQIWEVEVPGGKVRRITKERHHVGLPRPAPAGDLLACAMTRPVQEFRKAYPKDVLLIDRRTGKRRVLLAQVHAIDLAWSPDAKTIAVSLHNRLLLVDVASGKTTRTFDWKKVDRRLRAHGAYHLRWSPDGKRLAGNASFLGGREAGSRVFGDREIFVLDLATGEIRFHEVPEGARPRPLHWSR